MFAFVLAMLVGLSSGVALAGAPVFETPESRELVRGAHNLKKGYNNDALRNFKRAAEYGSKDAQKTIGMLYINGAGVPMDWARGYAWLKLSATHGDPEAVSARDQVFAQLKDEEKATVDRIYAEIDAEYGDQAALARREEWVRKQKREITGSRTGASSQVRVQVADATGFAWEVSGAKYFELLEGDYILEFRQRMGQVEIGELKLVDDDRPEGG